MPTKPKLERRRSYFKHAILPGGPLKSLTDEELTQIIRAGHSVHRVVQAIRVLAKRLGWLEVGHGGLPPKAEGGRHIAKP